MTFHCLIAIVRRLSHGFAVALVAILPLATFLVSLMALHKPEVIALLLLRTAQGVLEVVVLLATSILPLACVVLVTYSNGLLSSQYAKGILAAVLTGFYLILGSLLLYRIQAGVDFDLAIFRYHFGDSLRTLLTLSKHHASVLLVCAALSACHFYGLVSIIRRIRTRNWLLERKAKFCIWITLLSSLLASQWLSANGMRNLIVESSRGASSAHALYTRYFENSISRNQKGPRSLPQDLSRPNLFIVQLESINANLVTKEITPNLLSVAKEQGVLFPRIQASSVFTVLSMETILCGTLPSLELNLAQMEVAHSRLVCLPRILRDKGYKTLYFQAYPDLKFNNMDRFFRSIGFDETHGEDIMKPGDPALKWGFLEDVFYRRVFEYLEKYRNEKMFIYIVAGSANHYPFFDLELEKMFASLKAQLPYPDPRSFRERMANTTYIQDHFFGEMYRQLYSGRFDDKSQMFVLGDHSWPIEVHRGNNHNLKGAFQENFVTTMAFIPQKPSARKKDDIAGQTVSRLYSYLDFPATVLEMYGVREHRLYGQSFLSQLSRASASSYDNSSHCLISVQPFSGGKIAILNYPKKHIFDLKKNSMITYDLEVDPDEQELVNSSEIDVNSLNRLTLCLQDATVGHMPVKHLTPGQAP